MRIFRWHMTRKPEGTGTGWIEVIITPAAGRFAKTFGALRLRGPAGLPPESLASWNTASGAQLEGTTSEEALLLALARRNAVDREAASAASSEGRRLVEDMVLLQMVDDERGYSELWGKLKEAGDWPDVTELVTFPGARWLDYTRASRRMARDIYRKVLGEEEARGPARGKEESNA